MSIDLLAVHGAHIKTGTTSSSANTALATKIVNPFNTPNVQCLMLSGMGCYIEDDGSHDTIPSGITATTIDVRSTGTSEPFKVAIFPLGMNTPLNG